MSDLDALDERLRAVERALTDADDDLTDLRDAPKLTREIEALADRLDDVDERLDELDAATQALRGYVGNVRAVNESVERTADAALAKAEAMEAGAVESEALETATTESKAQRTDTLASEAQATEAQGSDGRALEELRGQSDSSTPRSCRCTRCGCASRRPDESAATDADTEDEGLLARVASALTGTSTGSETGPQ